MEGAQQMLAIFSLVGKSTRSQASATRLLQGSPGRLSRAAHQTLRQKGWAWMFRSWIGRKTGSHWEAVRVDTSLLCHMSWQRVKATDQGHQTKVKEKANYRALGPRGDTGCAAGVSRAGCSGPRSASLPQ